MDEERGKKDEAATRDEGKDGWEFIWALLGNSDVPHCSTNKCLGLGLGLGLGHGLGLGLGHGLRLGLGLALGHRLRFGAPDQVQAKVQVQA